MAIHLITLYKPNETDFTHNGIGILDNNIYEAEIEEILNGVYTLRFKYPLFAPHGLEIDGQYLIKAPTPDGNQLFRVANPHPTNGELQVFCYHIFYDLTDNFIEDTNIVDKTGVSAIAQIKNNLQYTTKFDFFSDITKVNNSRLVRKNPVEVLLDNGQDNSFLNRWGGELLRDNFNVRMLNARGLDRGVVIQHKKDLLGYEADIDWQSPITKIMPQGANELLLPEKYVTSPLVNKYVNPKIRKIEFPNVKAKVGEYANDEDAIPLPEALDKLRAEAKAMFEVQHVDQPLAIYKIKFQELSQTEEYKDFAVMQRVYMGDTVTVQHLDEGIDVKAKVVSYKYDPLNKEYTDITIGNYKQSFADVGNKVDKLKEDVDNMESSFLDKAKKSATDLINSGFGGHVRIYPERILIMDTNKESTAQKVWQWNINGLGYSKTGINGPYGLAMTMDGRIVADFITAGTINAALAEIINIKAESIVSGKLSARNNTFKIDLDRSAIDFFSVTNKISTTISQARASDGREISYWTIESTANSDAAISLGKRNPDGTVTQSVYIDGKYGDFYSFSPSAYLHSTTYFKGTTVFEQPIEFRGTAARFDTDIRGKSWSLTNFTGMNGGARFAPNESGKGALGDAKNVWGEVYANGLNGVSLNGLKIEDIVNDSRYGRSRADAAFSFASDNRSRIDSVGTKLNGVESTANTANYQAQNNMRAIIALENWKNGAESAIKELQAKVAALEKK